MADENTVRSGNLFDFATSELSQDAFVCWLCSRWDDPDDTVRAASQNLLHAMLGSDDPTPVRVPRVARQRCHVDVALLTEHAGVRRIVIVEDKTGSVDHDDQLRRYPEQADDLFPGERRNRHDCGLTPINDRRGFSSRRSPVAIIGLIDTIPDTPEGLTATAGQLDEMVDAAIGEYQAWCDRNRPEGGEDR